MSVIKILQIAMKERDYDGLFVGGICGCKLDDLSPANCLSEECETGYLHTHSKTGEWVIHSHKEPIGDERISEIVEGCN